MSADRRVGPCGVSGGRGRRQGRTAPSRGNRNGKPGRWTPVQMHVF